VLTSQAHLPSPSFLNVHGLTATGKSSVLRAYFCLPQIPHTIINVRECITTRHLLERIVAASLDALEEAYDETIDRRPYARTENLSALCVNLQKMLEGRGTFVLVLDAIDKLREGGGTLIPALGRLGEAVRPPPCNYGTCTDNTALDTEPRLHSHNDSSHCTFPPTLLFDTLHLLPALHTPTAPHHPWKEPTKGLCHTPFRREVPRLYSRSRSRRRRLAVEPIPWRRLRLTQQTHRPRSAQLPLYRLTPMARICCAHCERRVWNTGLLAPHGKPPTPLPG
jgi:hypothetical protein